MQGQSFAADGTLANGKKWFSIDGSGTTSAPTALDLTNGDYAMVFKDQSTTGGSDGVTYTESTVQTAQPVDRAVASQARYTIGYGLGALPAHIDTRGCRIGAIEAWLPLLMFVILFGLSMDYHVFVTSRVREARDAGVWVGS